jgi:hypothetical protein
LIISNFLNIYLVGKLLAGVIVGANFSIEVGADG